MADQLKLRGGSKETSEQFIGAEREVTVDTTLHSLRVHDGETPGGHLMMRAGNCLVVSDPGEPCKVTVNGELETTGDTHVDGNLVVDGNILIDGHLEIIDDTVGIDTGHVVLTNPRRSLPANIGDLGTHIPTPLGELKTQEDLNQYNVNIFNEFDKALIQDDNDLKQLDQLLQAETNNRIAGDANLQNQVDELKAYNVTNDAAHSAIQKAIVDGDALLDKRIDELKVEDLYDVDASSAEVGDILQRKGQGWLAVSADAIAGTTIEKLDDINDCNVPSPQNGQILTRRGAQWVAENNPFVDQQVKFKTFINTADVDAPVAEAGDVYVQHSIQEFATVVAGPTWTGIAGENVIEGQYIIYGSNNQWHKGTSLTSVEDVQSDWEETNTDSLTYIHNKPDLYTKEEIDDAIAAADGANADWTASTTDPGYILNKPDLDIYATKNEVDGKLNDYARLDGALFGGQVTVRNSNNWLYIDSNRIHMTAEGMSTGKVVIEPNLLRIDADADTNVFSVDVDTQEVSATDYTVTAKEFIGDGSQLTGVTADIATVLAEGNIANAAQSLKFQVSEADVPYDAPATMDTIDLDGRFASRYGAAATIHQVNEPFTVDTDGWDGVYQRAKGYLASYEVGFNGLYTSGSGKDFFVWANYGMAGAFLSITPQEGGYEDEVTLNINTNGLEFRSRDLSIKNGSVTAVEFIGDGSKLTGVGMPDFRTLTPLS